VTNIDEEMTAVTFYTAQEAHVDEDQDALFAKEDRSNLCQKVLSSKDAGLMESIV
jgi:hypothetical protein